MNAGPAPALPLQPQRQEHLTQHLPINQLLGSLARVSTLTRVHHHLDGTSHAVVDQVRQKWGMVSAPRNGGNR